MIAQNAAWEYGWPFLCKKCVGEMSHELGITKETVEVEVVKEVEVVRDPTDAEMLAVIAARFSLAPHGDPAPVYGQSPIESVLPLQQEADQGAPSAEERAVCVCGAEFTGPTAKAKLGSHKTRCAKAKEAGAHG
jgi:hypothetical protein